MIKNEAGKSCTFRLSADIIADILAMAHHVGDTGNLTAGLRAIFAEWRRQVTEDTKLDRAKQLAQHEEYCDALERRAEAEGR